MKTKITCHKTNRTYQVPHFFILSKGNNAGKPLDNPCPNCFVVLVNDTCHRDQHYWLCYGLWLTGQFRPYLNGSVIPFIHIDDMRAVIRKYWTTLYDDPDKFLTAVHKLKAALALEQNLLKQINSVRELKQLIIRKALSDLTNETCNQKKNNLEELKQMVLHDTSD